MDKLPSLLRGIFRQSQEAGAANPDGQRESGAVPDQPEASGGSAPTPDITEPEGEIGFLFREAKFPLGAQVKHRFLHFRGVVFDVDPEFNNTEEWYQSIPAQIRPPKNQPFYHLLAENVEGQSYVAYVSEQNLLDDSDSGGIRHDALSMMFSGNPTEGFQPRKLPN